MSDGLMTEATDLTRGHTSPCPAPRGGGFFLDVEEDGTAHGLCDGAGRPAAPGKYRVRVRRPLRLGDRFADGQRVGCGDCAARLAQPPAPSEGAPLCAACGLRWVTRAADVAHCPECATSEGSATDAVTDAAP